MGKEEIVLKRGLWQKLLGTKIKNKEFYAGKFNELVQGIQKNTVDLKKLPEEKNYFIDKKESCNELMLTIVPKELKALFDELKAAQPDSFLGFTVLAGKQKNKQVRVSCFGVECSILSKALIK